MSQWFVAHGLISLGCFLLILLFGIFVTLRSIDQAIRHERMKMIEDILRIVNGLPEAGGWHPHLTYQTNKLIAEEFEKRLAYMRTKRKNASK